MKGGSNPRSHGRLGGGGMELGERGVIYAKCSVGYGICELRRLVLNARRF
jgi:hypothetical protein